MRTISSPRSISLLATPLLAGLLSTGCGAYVRSTPSQVAALPGRHVIVSHDLPGDLTELMTSCTGRLTLSAGQRELDPRRDLLPLCMMPNGDVNENPISEGDGVDEATSHRLKAIAGVLVDEDAADFEAPIPSALPSRDVASASFNPSSWILPLVDAQLRSSLVPPAARDAVRAQVEALVARSSCRLSARVDVRFLRAGLEDFSLAWAPAASGAPSLQLDANLDDSRAVATYKIVPEFRCNGSTGNLVHDLLRVLLPGDARPVFADGSITVAVALRPDGSRLVGASELSLDLNSVRISRPFDWVPAAAWAALLADLQVTPSTLAAEAGPVIGAALQPLSALVADGVTDALALRSDERVGSIRVVDGAGGRELSVHVSRPTPPPTAPTCQTTITGLRICR